LDPGILAELGGGLLNLANLGFLQRVIPYCGIPQWYLRFAALVFAVGQIFFSFLAFLIVLTFFNRIAAIIVFSMFTLLFMLSAISAVISGSMQGVVASFRRFTVTLLWPVFHFLAAPVGFGLVAIVAVIFSVRISNAVNWQSPGTGLVAYAGLRIAVIAALIIVSYLVQLPVRWLLKVLVDVARYAGSMRYRERLRRLLVDKLQQLLVDCESLIIIAHSLGSVIAVDCLLDSQPLLRKVRQLHFVTHGLASATPISQILP
jgi:hypothetical protein